ncbi:EAL domain-containing protein [Phormidesmis sp. 146-12]
MLKPPSIPHRIPLRLILVLPFVLQILTVVGLTSWISLRNNQRAIHNLSSQLQAETSNQISHHLDGYLQIPHQINQTNLAAIELGLLNLKDLKTTGQFFWKQMQIFNVGYINFGGKQGEFIGVERLDSGSFLINESRTASPDKTSVYEVDRQGRRTRLEAVLTNQASIHDEGWYADAVKSGRPTWSRIYQWQDKPTVLSISSSYPIYDKSQKLVGVIGVDLILSQVSEFLRGLRISPSGRTFIIERNGLLVASSVGQPFVVVNGEAKRLSASQSADEVTRSTLQHLSQHFGNLNAIQGNQQFSFERVGVQQFVSVSPWNDRFGLDWLIVVVVPESDFMEVAHHNTQATIFLCLLALVAASAIGAVTSRRLVEPILRMVNTANALSSGDWQQRVQDSRISEISLLSTAFNRMAGQLQSSFTTLVYTASHDALTGLLNRNSFQQKLHEVILHYEENNRITTADSTSSLFAVLFLDLDHFKFVNDSLGHLIGDQLLISVARRLSLCLRSIDIIGRFGGDEFIILLNQVTDITDVTRVADRILEEFEQPFNVNGNEIFIGMSIGIVLSTIDSKRPESFLRNADIALYHAKLNGKAGYDIFNANMHTQAVERLQLETDLRRAIEREEFEVYYQPIVHSQTACLTGFEALVRWNHPTQGRISPAKFIPIAEETGLIVKLGGWVLQQACSQMSVWQQQFLGCRSLTVSVNLSGRQFLQIDLLEQINHILIETQLPPQSLKLEITETIFMQRGEVTRAKVGRLKHLGIQISVDDFGTGYSSLSYLHRFPANTLKIDSSFIHQLDVSAENRAIVEAIIVLAHKLGMDVVAEGVETIAQLESLQTMQCDQIQGYLFSPPLSANHITELLMTQSIDSATQYCWKIDH